MKAPIGRENNYDLLRVVSACAVILLHVNAYYFIEIAETPAINAQYITGSIINIVTRFSVPCFFMMSGAFNLSKEKNAQALYFYKRALKKTFLPLVVITIIIALKDIVVDFTIITTILIGILQGSYNNTWFMYVLAGLYLATPFIIRVKKTTDSKVFCIIAICMLVWGIISQATSSYHISYTLGNVFSYMGYYLIGNILYEKNKKEQKNKKKGNVIRILVIVVSSAIAFIARYMGVKYYLFATHSSFFSPAVVAISVCIFSLFAQMTINIDFSLWGKLTFFVYLFHRSIYLPIISLPIWEKYTIGLRVLLVTVITCILSFAVSWLFNIIYDRCVNKWEMLKA